MVALRVLTLTVLFSALLAVEVVNKLVVSKAEVELVVEKTKATTEFLVSIGPFGVYFLSVTVVKHIFEKVFVVKLKVTDVREVFYKNALNFGKELGVENSENLAEDVANAAEKAFQDNISPLEYFRVVSETLKRSLKKHGLLNQENAKDLIDAYASSLESAANSENSADLGAPVQALETGTANFIKSRKLQSSKDIEFAEKTFANELKNQAGHRGDAPSSGGHSGPKDLAEGSAITGAHDDTDITDAHNAAGLINGRIEISYLLTFFLITKCLLLRNF